VILADESIADGQNEVIGINVQGLPVALAISVHLCFGDTLTIHGFDILPYGWTQPHIVNGRWVVSRGEEVSYQNFPPGG
jgi:hypothetical protein